MKYKCPNIECYKACLDPKSSQVVSKGSYYRSSDSRKIQRFKCKSCGRLFSQATFSPQYWQKKRRINQPLFRLLCSGVSQRRAAKLLGVNPKTVVRRFHFLADQSRQKHTQYLKRYETQKISHVMFDDLETIEHTKCKPLSVTLAVDAKTRKILSFAVSQMPAKGHLSKKSILKYGKRKDQRPKSWDQVMRELKPMVAEKTEFTSDENPHYPNYLKRHHPKAKHTRVKGGRGCIAGQGELKKLGFDPLFALNHTCAMLRANINRLFRKTWCTTKKTQGLVDHLSLYVDYHNRVLVSEDS